MDIRKILLSVITLAEKSTSKLGRKSKKSLYNHKLATFEEDNLYDQKDATGFIKLNSLRLILDKIKNK